MITITKAGARFEARFPYNPDAIALCKSLRFRWDAAARCWWTNDEEAAAAVQGGAALDAYNQRQEHLAVVRAEERRREFEAAQIAVEASRATDALITLPRGPGAIAAGHDYLGYQRAGIAYALDREGVLIGDEMGLGKTVQAIGVSNADASIQSVLIICPAFLKLNWEREWRKWDTKALTVAIANGKWPEACDAADVVIINYENVKKHRALIDARQWDLLVVDECHYLKNPKAQRTKSVLGAASRDADERVTPIAARRRVFMTGTPICNRPIELWPLVQSLDPAGLGRNFFQFAKRYCAAHNTGYGWDFTGSSNLDELQVKLRAAFMVRRLKADVLTELPAKRRQIVPLTSPEIAKVVGREAGIAARWEELSVELEAMQALALVDDAYQKRVEELQDETDAAFESLAKARHDVALAKLPAAVEYIRDAIEELGCVAIMCHHQDVAEGLREAFAQFGSVVVHGGVSIEDRQAAVDAFQRGDANVFIGTIKTGVGYTITRASHMFMVELDWVPGNVSQAEDRIHRIGQTQSVLIQHLVADGSIDARMAQTLVAKQEVIDSALDNQEAPVEAPVIEPYKPISQPNIAWAKVEEKQFAKRTYSDKVGAAYGLRAESLDKVAAAMNADQIAAVHVALRMLEGMNQDRATEKNYAGFNSADTWVGKALAEMPELSAKHAALGAHIVRKYRRQYGQQLFSRIFLTEAAKERA